MKKYNNGFTLVEMLVAMLLFALLAVMLIPNVTKNAEKNLFTTQASKVQNDVQQAFLWIISENQGSMKTACSSGADGRQCIRNLIAGVPGNTNFPKKLESYCSFGHGDANDRDKNNGRKDASNPAKQDAAYLLRNPEFLNSTVEYNNAFQEGMFADDSSLYHAVYLKNGAYVSPVFLPGCLNGANAAIANNFVKNAGNTPVCGYVEVDLNGPKIPNIVGKDIHYFWITEKDGLVPFGEIDNLTCGNPNDNGNYANPANDLPENDNAGATHQLGCTARLLNMGRIDYYR